MCRVIQEHQITISNFKKSQDAEKRKTTQIMDEIRKKEETSASDFIELKVKQ